MICGSDCTSKYLRCKPCDGWILIRNNALHAEVIAASDPSNNLQEGKKRTKDIGMDISKKKCSVHPNCARFAGVLEDDQNSS